MERRGQAAMEFLMTYGWAILAAIIVIAVLAIYFRPSSLTPKQAVVSAPFYAVATSVNTTSVLLELRNNGGESYNNVNVSITPTQPTGISCDGTGTGGSDPFVIGTMPAGQTNVSAFTCTTMTAGATFQANIKIDYYRTGSSILQSSTGTLSGTVA